MPPLEMRGRYIQREWFSDTDLQTKVSADVREFYFGLAMLADDEGWMPRDVVGIGAAIYRFRAIEERESTVRANLDVLTGMGKVRSHRCKCLFLPTVARMGRAGHKNTVHSKHHQEHLGSASKKASGVQKGLDTQPVLTSPDLTNAGVSALGGASRRGPMTKAASSLPFAFEDAVPNAKPS